MTLEVAMTGLDGRTSRGFRTRHARAGDEHAEPAIAENATVTTTITLHYAGLAGSPDATRRLEPGARVEIIEHDPAGLYRIRVAGGSERGALVDAERVRPDEPARFPTCSPPPTESGSAEPATPPAAASSPTRRSSPAATRSATTSRAPARATRSKRSRDDTATTSNEPAPARSPLEEFLIGNPVDARHLETLKWLCERRAIPAELLEVEVDAEAGTIRLVTIRGQG